MRTKLALALAAAVLLPAIAGAQDTTRTTRRPTTVRRQQPIEIRGQVPTPQVVTVRPREVPAYSRQVLVPNFYDHDFWPEIQEGYAIMSTRTTPATAYGSTPAPGWSPRAGIDHP